MARCSFATPHARIALVPVLAAGMLAGCEGLFGPDAPGAPEKIDKLPRELSVAEHQAIAGSNAFAFDLLREVHAREDESPNVFLSPLSASIALGMTLNGAAGETFDSIRAVLGLEGLSQEEINRSYTDLTELLLGLDPRVELGIANSAWSRMGFPFVPEFLQTLREWFDAEARELDFADPGAVDVINGWAAEKTNGRIDEVIQEISPNHFLFLLNAVYFNGDWTDRFDAAETRPEPFTLADGTVVEVERMHGRPNAGVAYVDGITIGELPYGGEAFVMTVVLPPADGTLEELIAELDAETWARWTDAIGQYTETRVGLPKLELEYDEKLNDALKALGMGPAFDRRADFSRLTPAGAAIDYVKQNTFLRVDEEGTEAAAVTTIAFRVDSAGPPSLIIDRPYLLAIRERLSGTILFLGAIGDPRAG